MSRQRHASIEVLKEQKYELEKKLEGLEKVKEKVVKLEAELEAARQEREEWCIFFSSYFHLTLLRFRAD